ncbi:acetolactate synthase large subunit [Fictibacillus sp. Mic-4]|uniref:acetolactate synthase large subunit n=1 Tax=Fictibacillus sp. Mic-4 TaxID=3132826 RepID=UPI003CEC752C
MNTEMVVEEEKQTVKMMNGAEMVLQALEEEKVEVLFGYPGGAVLPIYDALYKKNLRHILTRHEQGAIHAAQGYARVTGKVGVVLATSGPGATNLITGIADAMIDSLPLVILTGQVATTVIGTDAFQEADVLGITMPITKHNYQVRSVEELPGIIKEAFHIARSGRPGPVLIDIPKDVSNAIGTFSYDKEVHLPGYQPKMTPNILQVRRLNEAIANAKKPVILAGAGVLFAKGHNELLQMAETLNIPVTNTLLGLGSFPADHPLFLGMAGMHGTYAANIALYECDLLINIGARFDDRLTGNLNHFAKNAVVSHIDIDPAEIGKNVKTHIPIVADAKKALEAILEECQTPANCEGWIEELGAKKESYPLWYEKDGETLKPQRLLEIIHEVTKGEAIVTTDVGQHQMWAAQYYKFKNPHRWVTSGGLGTMGFGLPSAIGAQIAEPDSTVVAVVGDAGFQMTLQELSMIQELSLPLIVVIVNNLALGMVRQWQEEFYEKRYSESLLPVQPDFVKLAEAYDIKGAVAVSEEEVETHLRTALETKTALLLDVRVTPDEKVYPMIAPGKGLHEMIGVKP